jgi:hypothetical protein
MVLGWRWRRDAWLVGSVVLAVLIVGTAFVYRSGPPSAGPSAGPETLPEEGVLSLAELAFSCVRGCTPVLLLADGREFTIPTDASSVRDVTLSPDGRWLGYPLGTGFVVRDLLGSDGYRLGSRAVNRRLAAWAWSADSSLLLLADLRDGRPEEFFVQNLPNRSHTSVTVWPGHELLGVRPPSELITVRTDAGSGARVAIDLTNEFGRTTASLTVDAADRLGPRERLEPTSLRFTDDFRFEVVVVRGDDDQPVAVLRYGGPGGGTGGPGGVSRHELTVTGPGRWSVLGAGEAGRAFARVGTGRTVVWYLAPDGTFSAGRDLTGDAEVVTPGTVRS